MSKDEDMERMMRHLHELHGQTGLKEDPLSATLRWAITEGIMPEDTLHSPVVRYMMFTGLAARYQEWLGQGEAKG